MTIVKTTCANCGDVELSPAEVTIILAPTANRLGSISGEYEFTCRDCGTVNIRPATERVISVLLASGSPVQQPPITEEEIQAFIRTLE